MNRDQVNLSDDHERLKQPDITHVIEKDPLSPLSSEWRKLQSADHRRWSRRYLLPLIRIICLLFSWAILLVKRLIPLQLGSERLLNGLSQFFMKNFASPEAQEMLYRHFSVENALVHFIIQNSGAPDIALTTLKPVCPEQLGDVSGSNATLMHDTIILNLFDDLSRSQGAQIKTKRQIQDTDFSALSLPEFTIYGNNTRRLFNIDFESCLYISVLVLTLCFTSKQIENAVGSLFLDNSLMTCLANLTGINCFRYWAVFAPGDRLHIPLDPARYLYRHILIHEYAYHQLQLLKGSQQITENGRS